MGLEVETVEEADRAASRSPTMSPIRRRARDDWDEWLQTHRVELNAMTTPQLIDVARREDGDLRRRQADPA